MNQMNHEDRIHKALITDLTTSEFTTTSNGVSVSLHKTNNDEDNDTILSFVRWNLRRLGYSFSEMYHGAVRNSFVHHFTVS